MLDDPDSFKTKEESKLGVLEDILKPDRFPELYGDIFHKVRINYYPPRGDNKEGWDNIDIFGWLGYPMQLKVDFLCRDSILAAPLALDLVLFTDLAQRAGLGGIQEWLSFYYKSPQTPPGLYPEHDLFIQHTKLKNTLRWMMGEDQITHLGREYYATPTADRRLHRLADAAQARSTSRSALRRRCRSHARRGGRACATQRAPQVGVGDQAAQCHDQVVAISGPTPRSRSTPSIDQFAETADAPTRRQAGRPRPPRWRRCRTSRIGSGARRRRSCGTAHATPSRSACRSLNTVTPGIVGTADA